MDGSTTARCFRGPTRRDLLRAGGSAALLTYAFGCEALSTDPAASRDNGAAGAGRNGAQAPMLATRVEAGDLPPVADRVPPEPLVIEPTNSVGRYGGTWRHWIEGTAATYKFDVTVGYDRLVRWDPEWSTVIPNLAESWDVGRDGREYTFHLRTGIKWSDGEPFTASDVAFAYDNVIGNTDLYPVPPSMFVSNQQLAALDQVDDYTLRFVFDQPNSLFLQHLAGPLGYLLAPRHYLEQFHEKYNEDAAELADDEGFPDWIELFSEKNDPWMNPDLPVVYAWQVVDPLGEGNRTVFQRNPFYWKVDSEGSQLPYLDEIRFELIQESEVALLKSTKGEIDFNHARVTDDLLTAANKPVFARDREQGDYRFVDGISSSSNHMVIALNLTHEDPGLREVFNQRDFRIGLSHAIDRQELIATVFQQQGEPWQAAPREESDVYHDALAKQYTEYDLDRANEHLDAAGYNTLDNAGFRLRTDGERISFSIDVSTDKPDQIDALELIKDYWAEVGIDMNIGPMDRSLFTERRTANLHEANVWGGDGGYGDVLLEPGWYFPFDDISSYATMWAEWYNSQGQEGEEPPAAAREQMELYDQLKTTLDEGKQLETFMRILNIAAEQFWVIGTVLKEDTYSTVKNSFHNVPDTLPGSWLYPTPGPTRPEQYWTEA